MVRPLAALLFVTTALVAGAATDRPAAPPARVAAGLAAAHRAASPWPAFTLFGWVSPPLDSTTAARYAELADAGFNMTVLAWEDSGRVADNRARLEYTRPVGVRNLLFDRDLERVVPFAPATYTAFDSVALRYRDDPAFLGYYLGDEPPANELAALKVYFDELRARDPAHPSWNNLLGRAAFATQDDYLAYTRRYADLMHPSVLCNDHYDFRLDGDVHQLVLDVSGLASVAREYGLPFWGIVLLIQHKPFRDVDAGMLRWQIAQWLAYGASGIGYFTYWTPAPNPYYDWQPAMIAWGTGARTAKYDLVRILNRRLRPLGETLARLQWLATEHAGSVEPGGTPFAPDSILSAVRGRCALGWFADSVATPHLFVANSDSAAAQTIALDLAGVRDVAVFDSLGAWRTLATEPAAGGVRASLTLAPGDFVLLRLSRRLDAVGAGPGPLRLELGPNPARGTVRFEAAGLRGNATFELLDVRGRRVYSQRFVTGARVFTWAGERDGGGTVAPGVYFARLEDASAVRVRRLVWLGSR